MIDSNGRGGGIRTPDPLLPNQEALFFLALPSYTNHYSIAVLQNDLFPKFAHPAYARLLSVPMEGTHNFTHNFTHVK